MKRNRLDYRLAQAYMFGSREECLHIIGLIEIDADLKIKAKNSNGERLQEMEETKKTKPPISAIKKKNK